MVGAGGHARREGSQISAMVLYSRVDQRLKLVFLHVPRMSPAGLWICVLPNRGWRSISAQVEERA
jgi:hypothetical protein